MATNIPIINESFSGKVVDQIIISLYEKDTNLRSYGARVMPGYKSKATWIDLDFAGQLKAYACEATPTNDYTATQKTVEMCSLQLSPQICNKTLTGSIREQYLRSGMPDESFSDDQAFFDAMVQVLMSTVQVQLNDIWLRGDTTYPHAPSESYLDTCDGLLAQWDLDADVIDVVGTPITAANVQAELNKVLNATTSVVLGETAGVRPAFGVSSNIFLSLQQSYLAGTGNNYVAETGRVGTTQLSQYLGYDIVKIPSLPINTMFFTNPNNLGIFFDGDGDQSQLDIVNLRQYNPANDKTQMNIVFRTAVMYGRGEYITYYKL